MTWASKTKISHFNNSAKRGTNKFDNKIDWNDLLLFAARHHRWYKEEEQKMIEERIFVRKHRFCFARIFSVEFNYNFYFTIDYAHMDFSSHFCSLRLRKKLKLTHYHNQVIHLLNGMTMMKFQKKVFRCLNQFNSKWFFGFQKKAHNDFQLFRRKNVFV